MNHGKPTTSRDLRIWNYTDGYSSRYKPLLGKGTASNNAVGHMVLVRAPLGKVSNGKLRAAVKVDTP